MVLAFPEDKASWAFEEQYMLGPSLLVAPILQPGGSVEVYLPDGTWYDLNTGEELAGGRVILYEGVPLDKMPMFGRKGGWLNLGPVVQHTGELTDENREQEIWLFGEPDPNIGIQSDTLQVITKNNVHQLISPDKVQITQFGNQ
jgi:alpha-D-xyloside xylohydrolase